MLTVSTKNFLWFVDEALNEMAVILKRLGDETGNRRPNLEGANSPYAILTHCLGVMEFWGGQMVAGRVINRDRDAEFRAEGSVDALIERTIQARRQLEDDVRDLSSDAPPRQALEGDDAEGIYPYARTQGAVLLEELTQHLGHMELTRDVLLADG